MSYNCHLFIALTVDYCSKNIFRTFTTSDKPRLMSTQYWLLPFLVWGCSSAFAQTTSLTGNVNRYTKVMDIDQCENILLVSSTEGFIAGTAVILMQMNGAVADDTDSPSFGQLVTLGAAGLHERATIDSVAGSFIFLKNQLLLEYDTQHDVQLISLPQYQNATVEGTLSPTPWNGQTGGVLALEVSELLTLNAPIDATGMGFRGGEAEHVVSGCNFAVSEKGYFFGKGDWRGAAKGEGIVKWRSGMENGRGAWSTGGGGGNDHNSGGGGGGHVETGGQGGFYDTQSLFGCNGRQPGLGGWPVLRTADRIFLGGGGGAGHTDDEGGGTAGGRGGGIVILLAKSLTANGNTIAANGINPPTTNSYEGAGGGGAGGTIIVEAQTITGTLYLEAKGADGGHTTGNSDRCFGPGGGGSGGSIRTNILPDNVISDVNGGAAGVVNGILSNCEGTHNGSTAGKAGAVVTYPGMAEGLEASGPPSILKQPESITICQGEIARFSISTVNALQSYQWQINREDEWIDIDDNPVFSGSATAELTLRDPDQTFSGASFRVIGSTSCFANLISLPATLTILEKPTAAFDFAQEESVFTFTNNSSGATAYSWNFGDGQSSMEESPSHEYRTAGEFEVTLVASGECSDDTITRVVTTLVPPIADFSSDQSNACAPHTIEFSVESAEEAPSIRWSFPGGEPASSEEAFPVVTYTDAGFYPVSLWVSNAAGSDSIRVEDYVQIIDPPKAEFSCEVLGRTVFFSNTSNNALGFSWDFGDGSPLSPEESPSHVYSADGVYRVSLLARNEYCGSGVAKDLIIGTITATEDPAVQSVILLYPNPVKDILQVEISEPETRLILRNTLGQIILEKVCKSTDELDLSGLSSGVYLIEMADRFLTRIVKE